MPCVISRRKQRARGETGIVACAAFCNKRAAKSGPVCKTYAFFLPTAASLRFLCPAQNADAWQKTQDAVCHQPARSETGLARPGLTSQSGVCRRARDTRTLIGLFLKRCGRHPARGPNAQGYNARMSCLCRECGFGAWHVARKSNPRRDCIWHTLGYGTRATATTRTAYAVPESDPAAIAQLFRARLSCDC